MVRKSAVVVMMVTKVAPGLCLMKVLNGEEWASIRKEAKDKLKGL
jgi:hypothetical protein